MYIYANPPLKPTVSIFFVFYSEFCFLPSKVAIIFHSFEDFGCLIIMSHDASSADTMTYSILMVFAALSTTVLCSQQIQFKH